jgi:hypothetical protein
MNKVNDLRNKKVILIQPSHHNGELSSQDQLPTNDSFRQISRQFQAPCWHITDQNIPLSADLYIICSFDINLIEMEIELVKQIHAQGGKTIIGFSQDLRFLTGGALLNEKGSLYTSLCEVTDAISSGVNPEMGIYGRFQDKVIPWGEVIEDYNWDIPYEDREYDLITCEALSEYALSFELEFLLMVKERHPTHRVASCIHGAHMELIETLRKKYPQIEFPFIPGLSLIDYIKNTKVFCNPEIRPRPCRTAMEAYYCRVPFISSSWTYHSRICPDFTYKWNSIVEMADKYDLIVSRDRDEIVREMEENAKYDSFDNVYKRIYDKLWG